MCRLLRIPGKHGIVTGLSLDSRSVQAGDLYAALPGEHTHGARFAPQSIAAGAAAILTDPTGAQMLGNSDVPVLVVPFPREVLGSLATLVYPGPRPRLIGITGTNGKTTTTYCVEAAARAAGVPTAVLGTLGVRFGTIASNPGRTTPEAPVLHAALQRVAEAGAKAAAMEVSSHALALHRVDGLRFDVAAFLGLSQDHLDFHHSMEDYFEAKARLFNPGRSDRAIINIDDEWGARLARETVLEHETYAVTRDADWTATDVAVGAVTRFVLRGPGLECPVALAMPGGFNIANAIAALASAHALGLDPAVAAEGLSNVHVPGRFESIANDRGIAAYADYAHTPDAVGRVLDVARGVTAGRLIAVIGCGGDRDPLKRPLMAAAAVDRADVVIVTDDNPRSEDPAAIRAAMLRGVPAGAHVEEIGDRAAAIARAVHMAKPGDCIMVLGKGHETGQEIAGVLHPFDDRDVLRRALAVTV